MRSYALYILAALLFPLCLCGCIQRPKAFPTGPTSDASRILESLKQRKNDLKSFRGVGKFKAVSGTNANTFRIVWIGSPPQNLRVETLGPWGQPTVAFVINGSTFLFHSREDNRCFKGDATADNLSRFLSIRVRAEDLFGLLSGQPPILPFHHAKIRPSTAEGGWLLSLYEKWGRLIERITLKEDAKLVEQVEVFDSWGNLQYRVAFSQFRQMESLCLPHRMAISNAAGPLWLLTVEKFWTRVSIPEEAYTLEVSGAEIVE
jgi:hypothetical protein